jgi:hypothetical protein
MGFATATLRTLPPPDLTQALLCPARVASPNPVLNCLTLSSLFPLFFLTKFLFMKEMVDKYLKGWEELVGNNAARVYF